MIIGVLKEIKPEEYRVAVTPAGVEILKSHGHTILVEKGAGVGSGCDDKAYRAHGAEIVRSAEEVYDRSAMVMHVKEPQPSEYPLIRPGQVIFTFFHLAANEAIDAGDDQDQGRRDRLRNHPEGRRVPPAPDPHERGGRTDGDPGGRQISRDGVRRARGSCSAASPVWNRRRCWSSARERWAPRRPGWPAASAPRYT